MQKVDYLIVGSGIAGVSAAEAIRERDREGTILLFSDEGELPYVRPMLTKHPFNSFDLWDADLHQPQWYGENKIDLRCGCRVEKLEPNTHTAWAGGEQYIYNKCILATGAYNFVPPFPGKDLKGVYTIRTKEDIRQIKEAAMRGKRAVIIGGGVIGLECALELNHYGVDVTVLEAMQYLMPRQLDQETSNEFQNAVKDIAIHTNVSIQEITGSGWADGVVLADGRTFPCDFVVVACGVRAHGELAQAAGIATERGIVVNERMETSAKDVYACGDCSQFQGINVALWSQGVDQGRVAGTNAAGGTAVYSGCDTSLVLNCHSIALFALGDLGQRSDQEEGYEIQVCRDAQKDRFFVNPRPFAYYEKKVYRAGKLVGAALIGNLSKMYALKKEIMEGGETV